MTTDYERFRREALARTLDHLRGASLHAAMREVRALTGEPRHARLTAPIQSGYAPTQLDPPRGEPDAD